MTPMGPREQKSLISCGIRFSRNVVFPVFEGAQKPTTTTALMGVGKKDSSVSSFLTRVPASHILHVVRFVVRDMHIFFYACEQSPK